MANERSSLKTYASNRGDEAAIAKLWAVYVSEAEKYDRALVESWRRNMEGILIFAGHFSAIPNSGVATVFILEQILRQLLASVNGTIRYEPQLPNSFVPSNASVICNTLWFISLGRSLSAALIATLLEQWARDFLHRANMWSAPVTRARIYSYMYYGIKRFDMCTVVEVIPLLLHSSLILFFGGLVAFLLPVNKVLMIVSAIILGLVVMVYAGLTILPLIYLDCPYHTPLSVKCVTDDQLELFGPNGRRDLPEAMHMYTLVIHPEVRLVARIQDLVRTGDAGLLSPDAQTRRQITCFKALWTIASLPRPSYPGKEMHHYGFDVLLSRNAASKPPEIMAPAQTRYYAISSLALMKWNMFCLFNNRILIACGTIATCQIRYWKGVHPAYIFLADEPEEWGISTEVRAVLKTLDISNVDIPTLLSTLGWLQEFLGTVQTNVPHAILFQYLRFAANLDRLPYEFDSTLALLMPHCSSPSEAMLTSLEVLYDDIVRRFNWETLSEHHHLDNILNILASLWRPAQNTRPSLQFFSSSLAKFENTESIWGGLMTAIKQGGLPVTSIDLCLTALWRLCGKSCEEVWRSLPVDVLRSALDEVSFLAPDSSSAMAPSVVALLKTRIIDALFRKAMDEEVSCVFPLVHDLVPADIALRATTEEDSGPEKPFKHYTYRTQWSEAKLEVLVEFLESAQNFSANHSIPKR
ncbi:hypothetical protein C8J57DRAFT_1377409 [Mycena rebaudengoi]|nr:hypothetical protein C8J57DRAFT_1377409 [Mycena rebaudengoi]